MKDRRLTAKDTALTVCFSALYAFFCIFPLFQIVGLTNQSITMAAVLAPIIGILLGPYFGILSTILGGIIGFFARSFFPPSFVSGVVAALCAGLLRMGRRVLCALVYLIFLIIFGFYPFIGPAWLFPASMWFQIVGFIILASPFQSIAVKDLNSGNNSKLVSAFFITALTSTLAGQIAGSLAFELILQGDANWWAGLWLGITLLYPVERTIIALAAAIIGAALCKVLKSANLLIVNRVSSKGEHS